MPPTPSRRTPGHHRSPCPLARGLDIFGDRWSLLVIRDLLFGPRRFKDFAASPEHIPTNLLSDRLLRLREHGLIEQTPAGVGARHLAYRLTPKGAALRPLLWAMRDWALEWEPGTRDLLSGGAAEGRHGAPPPSS